MLSVGIDVGTTTTQVVLSRLTVRNSRRLGFVPRLEVDTRAVLHQSQAHPTPLTAPDEVDVVRLSQLIEDEYGAAGIDPADVETGAVIITGETARTHNAEAILASVSGLAGDFVVTVAGPNLEAQIAGRGSGAAAWSAQRYTTVVNVDIGGGSSNAAVFRSGTHVASAAIMVGGRQAVLDRSSGILTHLAPSGKAIVAELGIDLQEGRRATLGPLRQLTDAMADLIVDLVLGQHRPLADRIALTPPLPPVDDVTAVFLSGGVGRSYYGADPADDLDQVAVYGDVGPLLARSLHEDRRLRELPVLEPAETIRATVLGAASQTVTLSGSTIWADPALLPLRNLPVIQPALPVPVPSSADFAATLEDAVRRWDRTGDRSIALALELPTGLDYPALRRLAEGVVLYSGSRGHDRRPVVLVTERDYAQVLGQTVKGLAPDLPLVAIDQIGLGEGDFIDIGLPMLDGRVVPVSVKTLVFYH
ncbi:ethanolamine ammonia-lyase reactivating factor EutA [Actinotalea sp. K2]|uniref:ethanolamine ammonia-lyase reactivating factor EutA n=1 Tax=Actinotalea sp. K2 TaxID=2939438 RepID=UPI0020177615|nr:ethanolamine ammonia-lyase reactivating factor EutA [Actinotalea sp. K2]MCL3859798.1 ethanolamine ammonia-lyase reactivating factor EutA [Actinotalea sp. K2]